MSLALVCGTGDLPRKVAASQTDPPFVCVLEGFAPVGLEPDVTFRLETLGTLLVRLGHEGVTEVCFCGGIDRPPLDPTALDDNTKPLVPLIAQALQQGDDGALRAVASLFEQTGFKVRAAHELADNLVAPPGVLTDVWPDEALRKDAQLGFDILATLSPFDVAQACVVGGGQLLGVETIAGTQALLSSVPKSSVTGQGVLVKGPKIGQDTRMDAPTIGPETVHQVVAAGLRGIVVDAGDVIVLHQEEVISLCDTHGLVLWSRERG